MGKAPAFQFYVKDWMEDVELQSASASSKGVWINALCAMWLNRERGVLRGTKEVLVKLLKCTTDELALFLEENEALGFCYVSQKNNRNLTLVNRRMYREEKAKKNNRERQQRYYQRHKPNAGSDGNLTPPSSSPPYKEKKYKRKESEENTDGIPRCKVCGIILHAGQFSNDSETHCWKHKNGAPQDNR